MQNQQGQHKRLDQSILLNCQDVFRVGCTGHRRYPYMVLEIGVDGESLNPPWPATEDEITPVLLLNPNLFGHHEQEYLLQMEAVELAVFVQHFNESINCSFLL